MGRSAGVSAYSDPHASFCPYHILQYIYILYTDFMGFICFFVEFYGFLYLLLVCRNVVRRPPTPYHSTAICTVLYAWMVVMI